MVHEEHLHCVTSRSKERFGFSILRFPPFAPRCAMVANDVHPKKIWGADSLLLDSINSVLLSWICVLKSDKSHVLLYHVPSSFVDSAKHIPAPSLCFFTTGYRSFTVAHQLP